MSNKSRKISVAICIAVLAGLFVWKGFFATLVSVESVIEDAGQKLDAVLAVAKIDADENAKAKVYSATAQEVRTAEYKLLGNEFVFADCEKRLKKLGMEVSDSEYLKLIYNDKFNGKEVLIYNYKPIDGDTKGEEMWRIILLQGGAPVFFDVDKMSANEAIYRYSIDEKAIYLHRINESKDAIITRIDLETGAQSEIARLLGQAEAMENERYNAKTGDIIWLENGGKTIVKLNIETNIKTKSKEMPNAVQKFFATAGGYLTLESEKIGELTMRFYDEKLMKTETKKVELPLANLQNYSEKSSKITAEIDGETLYIMVNGGNQAGVCIINIKTGEVLQAANLNLRSGYEIKFAEFANAIGEKPLDLLQ